MPVLSEPEVRLVQHAASDDSVVKAMLVSTQGDESLEASATFGRINYLMRNRHGTPFEHNSFTFFVKAPIMVFREFHRHRIWSYNELSGRYAELLDEFYIPPPERPLVQEGKTGHYTFVPGTEKQQQIVQDHLSAAYGVAWGAYQSMLAAGVAKEVARLCLPVGIYSQMYATCNARALMHFLSLRTKREDSTFPSYPQYEIEQVATRMETVFAATMPLTYRAFCENGRVAP